MPAAILFVCTANICRSPAAEYLARHRFGEEAALFRSAGFMFDGRESPKELASALDAKHVDVRPHRSAILDADTLAKHYEEQVGKGFYDDLVEFMSRGPVVAMVVEGPEDTWEVVRTMMGATNPRAAALGTIRGDLGILFTENLVHGSDSLASAEREIGIFFPNL